MSARERARRLLVTCVALAGLAVLTELAPAGAPLLAVVGGGGAIVYSEEVIMPALAWIVWLVYASRRAGARPSAGPPESFVMVLCASTLAIVAVAAAGRSEHVLAIAAAVAGADAIGWFCAAPEPPLVALARVAAYFPLVLATSVLFVGKSPLRRMVALGVYIYLAYAPAVPLAVTVLILAAAAAMHVHSHGVDALINVENSLP